MATTEPRGVRDARLAHERARKASAEKLAAWEKRLADEAAEAQRIADERAAAEAEEQARIAAEQAKIDAVRAERDRQQREAEQFASAEREAERALIRAKALAAPEVANLVDRAKESFASKPPDEDLAARAETTMRDILGVTWPAALWSPMPGVGAETTFLGERVVFVMGGPYTSDALAVEIAREDTGQRQAKAIRRVERLTDLGEMLVREVPGTDAFQRGAAA